MGAADIIPGVSGGTVALILGIYTRLVTAISRFDTGLVGLLRRRSLRAAAAHVDLRFLVALGLGIATGIVGLASLMHHLLNHEREATFAAFCGMIGASTWIVARGAGRWTSPRVAAALGGFAFAYWLVGLPILAHPPAGLWYVFLCGVVAICAMILPGISGAFILLILGKYDDVTGVLREFARGAFTLDGVLVVVTFAAGAAIGIVSFSKFLRWLLANHAATTMAILTGFMLGSLRKIWPFKIDVTPLETDLARKQLDNVLPDLGLAATWVTLAIALAGLALVLALDRVASFRPPTPERLDT